jgi:hypothetical protein
MHARLFRPNGGISFSRTDAIGPRLKVNLTRVSRPEDFIEGQIGDLFKVTYAANVPLQLRVAAVDANGDVLAEYGTDEESEEPGRRGGFELAVRALVASVVGGSPPGGVFQPAEG